MKKLFALCALVLFVGVSGVSALEPAPFCYDNTDKLIVKLKKLVAIKVLPRDRLQDDQFVARFQREMEAVGRLQHPNLVQATDAGEADGSPE